MLQIYCQQIELDVFINDFFFESRYEIQTNIIGHTVLYGKFKIFKQFHKNYNISIQKLEFSFAEYGLSVLLILCMKGFNDLLEYYLPLSLLSTPILYLSNINYDKLSLISDQRITNEYTPIQLACICNNISCIKVICTYFIDNEPP